MSRVAALALFTALLSPAIAPGARAEGLEDTAARVEDTVARSHLDVTLGLGTQTAGLGATLGYTADSGLRAEVSAGTAVLLVGGSAAFGAAFRVLDRGGHRLDVPVLASFSAMSCGTCGTDGLEKRFTAVGAATGLDWLVGHDGEDPGFVLALRVGLAGAMSTDAYDPGHSALGVMPIAQLGMGWTF